MCSFVFYEKVGSQDRFWPDIMFLACLQVFLMILDAFSA